MNKILFLLASIPLLFMPLAYASDLSTFDKNFKKCFDAAPAPELIKMGLPLKSWETIYKAYVGNLTMGKDIFPTSNLSMSINIAKQVDQCMRG